MDTTSERTISGRSLVVWGLAVAVVVTAISIVFGPGLREQVRQEQGPRTLREPVATGTYEGQVWEAVGRFDGTANCVELRYLGDVLGRACDAGEPPQTTTALADDGPQVAYGIAAEDAAQVTLTLDDGATVTAPVRAGELGFPVGFWAAELPPGASVSERAETTAAP